MEYLRICNYNKDNPNKVKGKVTMFSEYNPEKVAKEKLEHEELEIEARYKASHMEFDELKDVARAISLDVNRTASEIRHDVAMVAKKNPRAFLDALNNPLTKRRIEVLKAIELGVLVKGKRQIFIQNPAGNDPLVSVPIGEDQVDFFVNWTMNTKEGEEAWKKVLEKQEKVLG